MAAQALIVELRRGLDQFRLCVTLWTIKPAERWEHINTSEHCMASCPSEDYFPFGLILFCKGVYQRTNVHYGIKHTGFFEDRSMLLLLKQHLQTSAKNQRSRIWKHLCQCQVVPAAETKTLRDTIPKLHQEACGWAARTSMIPPPPEVKHATRG